VTFDVRADAYARFMGRYSEPLAVQFAELADLRTGHRALDVGCGPGALTAQLVERLRADAVSAIDPSPSFVAAIRSRFPEVDVQFGVNEHLPFPDDCFDLALAQLVVHFMTDAVSGLLASIFHALGVERRCGCGSPAGVDSAIGV
jgi:trans-aconitate methyltransferase